MLCPTRTPTFGMGFSPKAWLIWLQRITRPAPLYSSSNRTTTKIYNRERFKPNVPTPTSGWMPEVLSGDPNPERTLKSALSGRKWKHMMSYPKPRPKRVWFKLQICASFRSLYLSNAFHRAFDPWLCRRGLSFPVASTSPEFSDPVTSCQRGAKAQDVPSVRVCRKEKKRKKEEKSTCGWILDRFSQHSMGSDSVNTSI